MLKRSMISAGFLGAFVILAFGSGDSDSNEFSIGDVEPVIIDAPAAAATGGNLAACVAYVEHFNGLSCVLDAGKLDPKVMCPKELDQTPTDMASFYKCQQDNTTCDGAVLNAASASSCKPGQ